MLSLNMRLTMVSMSLNVLIATYQEHCGLIELMTKTFDPVNGQLFLTQKRVVGDRFCHSGERMGQPADVNA